ncbi:MAG TPA: hypothetical protein VMJ93_03415 [Verrucomicrobiae bacterium]|nr:hypothetical protein [Verrucomicrobiae bacterium]
MSAPRCDSLSLPAIETAAARFGRAAEFEAADSPEKLADLTASVIDQLEASSSPSFPPAGTGKPRKPLSGPVDPGRHRRLCAVCRHPEREAIEEAFLQWRNLYWVANKFGLPDRSSIYRHAHASGLFPRRKANLCFALEHIIEESERVRPTVSGIVEAVRAYAHIDDSGRWIESPTTHFVVPAAAPRPPLRRAPNRNTLGDRK